MRDFLTFLDEAPTAWHATEAVIKRLEQWGFLALREEEAWHLEQGKRYYVERNGSTVCAFTLPDTKITRVKMVGAHTDSPAFKLKPKACYSQDNMILVGTELYGSPLLSSWFNRDLVLAGRVIVRDSAGQIHEQLVHLKEHRLVIPQLALHLDRKVNDEGLIVDKQEHFSALAALMPNDSTEPTTFLESLLRKTFTFEELLAFDLFLIPCESGSFLGHDQEFIASYRMDNLSGVYTALTALKNSLSFSSDAVNMAAFWDNEEVGSQTAQGASSPLIPAIIERILLSFGGNREDYHRLMSRSQCLSVDVASGLHPNHANRHDPRHHPLLGQGVVFKSSSQQRYATQSRLLASLRGLCEVNQIPFQYFVSRNDILGGTTIGPLHATLTGMETTDIGLPLLSMHSIRELGASADHQFMIRLLEAFWRQSH